MISNTDRAWASVKKLRSRANYYSATAVISFILGFVTLLVAFPTLINNLGYSASSSAAGWVTFGVFMLSITSICLIAWVFTVTMANHAEVVYFSSSSNKERVEVVQNVEAAAPSLNAVIDEKYGTPKNPDSGLPPIFCSDCGVSNESGQKYCRVCGGILS